LKSAEVLAVALPRLCEFVRVLRTIYRLEVGDIVAAVRVLAAADNVRLNRRSVEAGLAMLEAQCDFADGVIACEGRWLGGDDFVSFDKKAVTLLTAKGRAARLLP
jgi:predicted nucleic-acid-binding protein